MTPPHQQHERPPVDPSSPDEASLLARLRAGDDRAFEQLVHTHGGRLLAVTRRITRSEQDAEDAVQEAFLLAFRSLSGFDGRSTLGTWLHRIAVNAALSKARKGKHHKATSIDELLPVFDNGFHKEHPVALAVTDDTSGQSTHQVRAVWDALAQLPDEYRDVVVLRDIEGLESKAAATSLGISDALVRQRLHRGRQALLKLLQQTLSEDNA